MQNINPFNDNSFAFYKEICEKKRNPITDQFYKNRLLLLDANVSLLFDQYDNSFVGNILGNSITHGYINQDKEDLQKLYKFNSATLQKLKNILTTSNSGRKVQCQNCTLNEVNSFDHLLPKEEFPEFSVHPKNLFPCCSKCNSYKGQVWRNNNVRTSLNLYLDVLPNIQYLFTNLEIGNNYIETTFYLENRNNVNPDLFELIKSHYNEFHLFERFSEGADDVITSFKNIIEPSRNLLSLEETKALSKNIIEKEKVAFGYNYWQSVLKDELTNSDDFWIDYE